MKKKIPALLVLAFTGILATSCGTSIPNPASSVATSSAASSSAFASSQPISSSVPSPLRKQSVTMYVLTDTGIEEEAVDVFFFSMGTATSPSSIPAPPRPFWSVRSAIRR